jgi:hypothetical protein
VLTPFFYHPPVLPGAESAGIFDWRQQIRLAYFAKITQKVVFGGFLN